MSDAAQITLIDNTIPDQRPSDDGEQESGPTLGPSSSLVHRVRKGPFREGHARRKYAKWQEDRYGDMLGPRDTNGSREGSLSRPNTPVSGQQHRNHSRSVSHRTSRVSRAPSDLSEVEQTDGELGAEESAAAAAAEQVAPQTEIDVLYENQRGWFFFGLPLFSHKSLLNLDPPAWMTRNNEKSPVSIANAQVPDPSWEWSWRTWYVDMSYDVDEEGWQYSFSFAPEFSWHGTHPWFHSFVRRRRWLRQRVKKPLISHGNGKSYRSMAPAWEEDYFTVRSGSVRSPQPSFAGGARSINSGVSKASRREYEEMLPPDEITNIAALSKAVKLATLDREKVDAVREFVYRGGEELVYLKEKIPAIMSKLVFQSSRHQLLDCLRNWVDNIPRDLSDETEKRRRDNLVAAMCAAEEYFDGADFWAD